MSSLETSPVEGFGLFTRLASLSSIPTRVGWRRPSRLMRMATTFLTRGPMVSIWSLRRRRLTISIEDMFLSTQVLHATTYHPSRTLVQVKSSSCLQIQNIRNSRLCRELMLEEGRFILTASLAMTRYDSDQARHTNTLTISPNKCNPISLPIFYLSPLVFSIVLVSFRCRWTLLRGRLIGCLEALGQKGCCARQHSLPWQTSLGRKRSPCRYRIRYFYGRAAHLCD